MCTRLVSLLLFTMLLLGCLCADDAQVKNLFKSEHYTVTWGKVAIYESDAELEVGTGSGHGHNLRWLRFMPGKDEVVVLSVEYDASQQPYSSKWPPVRNNVTVKSATLPPDVYSALLRDIALVDSVMLKPVKKEESVLSSSDFWVSLRLFTTKKNLVDLEWAGYAGSDKESEYAKPSAAVELALKAVENLNFQKHVLTQTDRAWAGVKFARDWKKYEMQQSYWWVRERYLEIIGVVADKAVLPVLRGILAKDSSPGQPRDVSEARCIYWAMNAVTTLVNTDVRPKPVEEMDIEKTRIKVIALIDQMWGK